MNEPMCVPPPGASRLCLGVDFSSAPSRRKPVVVAQGWRVGPLVHLHALQAFPSLEGLQAWLAQTGARAPGGAGGWVAGFDLPFGLPRELVQSLGWPMAWPALMDHYAALSRADIRARFAAFCAARPPGAKFAHRVCDRPAGSSPSMKWVNPPVAFMLHAGVPLLRAAGVSLPGLCEGDPQRVALEAYPGLLARELIGRQSYKADDAARQTPQRHAARQALVQALEDGRSRLGLRLVLAPAQRQTLCDDPKGDALDAVLCLLQAAWAQDQPRWGWPAEVDPLEGWILSA